MNRRTLYHEKKTKQSKISRFTTILIPFVSNISYLIIRYHYKIVPRIAYYL